MKKIFKVRLGWMFIFMLKKQNILTWAASALFDGAPAQEDAGTA